MAAPTRGAWVAPLALLLTSLVQASPSPASPRAAGLSFEARVEAQAEDARPPRCPRGYPPKPSLAARWPISSGVRSSLWVAMDQLWPKGSVSLP